MRRKPRDPIERKVHTSTTQWVRAQKSRLTADDAISTYTDLPTKSLRNGE